MKDYITLGARIGFVVRTGLATTESLLREKHEKGKITELAVGWGWGRLLLWLGLGLYRLSMRTEFRYIFILTQKNPSSN